MYKINLNINEKLKFINYNILRFNILEVYFTEKGFYIEYELIG